MSLNGVDKNSDDLGRRASTLPADVHYERAFLIGGCALMIATVLTDRICCGDGSLTGSRFCVGHSGIVGILLGTLFSAVNFASWRRIVDCFTRGTKFQERLSVLALKSAAILILISALGYRDPGVVLFFLIAIAGYIFLGTIIIFLTRSRS